MGSGVNTLTCAYPSASPAPSEPPSVSSPGPIQQSTSAPSPTAPARPYSARACAALLWHPPHPNATSPDRLRSTAGPGPRPGTSTSTPSTALWWWGCWLASNVSAHGGTVPLGGSHETRHVVWLIFPECTS